MGKTVLVTGANRGIGLEICKQLVDHDCTVIAACRNPRRFDFIHDLVDVVQLDVSSNVSCKLMAAKLENKYSHIDVLINNAGIMSMSSLDEFDIEELQVVLNTNYVGVYRTIKWLFDLLKTSDDARIINMSSEMGAMDDLDKGGFASYRLSKSNLNSLTIVLAAELKEHKIKVNSMCPGWVRTGMGGSAAPRGVQKGAETAIWLALENDIPTGKFFKDKKEIIW